MDLSTKSKHDLYQLWAESMTKLKERGMLVNGSPLGWAAEQLVCDRLGLDPTRVNTHHHDAIATPGSERYQIKGRTVSERAPNINGLQDLPCKYFDFLVVVVFKENRLTVHKAFKMPHCVVLEVAYLQDKGRNAYGFNLTDEIVRREGVEDITELLARPSTTTMPF